jgi:hypothetical protein
MSATPPTASFNHEESIRRFKAGLRTAEKQLAGFIAATVSPNAPHSDLTPEQVQANLQLFSVALNLVKEEKYPVEEVANEDGTDSVKANM